MENPDCCIICDQVLTAIEADIDSDVLGISVWLPHCTNMNCSRYGIIVINNLVKPRKTIDCEREKQN